jgi:hypothetical protein
VRAAIAETVPVEAQEHRMPLSSHLLAVASLAALVLSVWFAGLAVSDATRLIKIVAGSFRGTGLNSKLGQPVPATLTVRAEDGTIDTIDVSRGSAVMLVYDVRCSVCNDNMARWIDLVHEARQIAPSASIYAIPATADTAAMRVGYWAGLSRYVRVLSPLDSEVAQEIAGAPMTPMTVVIRDGVRVAAHAGYLGDRRREFLLRVAK